MSRSRGVYAGVWNDSWDEEFEKEQENDAVDEAVGEDLTPTEQAVTESFLFQASPAFFHRSGCISFLGTYADNLQGIPLPEPLAMKKARWIFAPLDDEVTKITKRWNFKPPFFIVDADVTPVSNRDTQTRETSFCCGHPCLCAIRPFPRQLARGIRGGSRVHAFEQPRPH